MVMAVLQTLIWALVLTLAVLLVLGLFIRPRETVTVLAFGLSTTAIQERPGMVVLVITMVLIACLAGKLVEQFRSPD